MSQLDKQKVQLFVSKLSLTLCLYSSFWMQQDFVTVWNVHGLDEADVQLANRTSNGLESYNCCMNNKVFPCAHPAVAIFVEYLKIETERVRDCIGDVRKGSDLQR